MNPARPNESLHLAALAHLLQSQAGALTAAPADALTLLHTLALPDDLVGRTDMEDAHRFFETTRSADPALILRNLEERWLCRTTLPQREALWAGLQSLLAETDLGLYDAFRLKEFLGASFTEGHLRALLYHSFFFCLFLDREDALPPAPAPILTSADAMPPLRKLEDYEPAGRTFCRTSSTAVQFQVHLGTQSRLFHFEDQVLEHIRANALMVETMDYERGVLHILCRPLPDGLRLVQLTTEEEFEQARDAVWAHLDEFRSKVTWNGRLLSDMLFHGMSTGIWSSFAYRAPDGTLASYIDYKRRACSDIEVGIQLTDPAYRKKHLAGSLLWLCMLKFMDADLLSGTYEENMAMRKAMLNCGFRPQDFRDPLNGLSCNRIRERVAPDRPEESLARTNSVYYRAPSLSSRIWQAEREQFCPHGC